MLRGAVTRLLKSHHRLQLLLSPAAAAAAQCSRSPTLLAQTTTIRHFESEREYHPVADTTLDTIQDALDEFCEQSSSSSLFSLSEVTLASGVLTFAFPPHGTWVINKQTPNRQLWWSSPLSGPKRFEYDNGLWYATKDGLNLGSSLTEELHHVVPELDKLDLRV